MNKVLSFRWEDEEWNTSTISSLLRLMYSGNSITLSFNMKVSFEILLPEETGKITMVVSEIRQEERKKN